jgi:hypothetical protein
MYRPRGLSQSWEHSWLATISPELEWRRKVWDALARCSRPTETRQRPGLFLDRLLDKGEI